MNELRNGSEVDIRIGELVIRGPGTIDRRRLAAAVEAELGRLVEDRGLRLDSAIHTQVDGGTIPPPPRGLRPASLDSAAVGRRVAQAVHRTIGGSR